MSKSVRIRRGSSIDHAQFAGAEGEITVDTTLDTIRVHDGNTLGGFPLLNSAKNSTITSDVLTANKIYYKNSFASQAAFPQATSYPGMVAYSVADSKAYISSGTSTSATWVALTQPSDLTNYITNSINAGTSLNKVDIALQKTGSNLVLRSLVPGNNMTLTGDATSVRFDAASYDGANTFDAGGAFGLYSNTDLVNHQLKFRSIRPGSGLTGTYSVSDLEISLDTVLKKAFNTVQVDTTAITTVAGDNTLTLASGSGIQLTPVANTRTVTVAVNLTAANDVNQAGSGVLKSYSAGAFVFNKIIAGTGIQINAGANGEISLSAPQTGTITSGANLGAGPSTGGTGIAVLETALSDANTLRFRRIRPGAGITVTMSDDQYYMDISSTLSIPGGAGAGVVNIGDQYQLAYYPQSASSTTVGPTPTGIYVNTTTNKIVANIEGQVSSLANHSTTDLGEGTNLYYTSARFDTALAGKSTTDLAEGTNLYFTNERAQDAVSTMLVLGNPNFATIQTTTTTTVTSTATLFVNSTSGIVQGSSVTGSGFPQGVTIQSVGVGSFVVSPAVYAPSGTSITIANSLIINTSGNSTSTATVTVTSGLNLANGWYVSGAGVTGRVQVTNINGNTLTFNPGYNFAPTLGTNLTFRAVGTTGLLGVYDDNTNSFAYTIDSNYLGDAVRNSFSVVAGQGLSYDPVQGRFGLSGAVTSVNGASGAVSLTVSDIPGAAPTASPTLTGTPRVADITVLSPGFQIANKNYVDAAKLAVQGSPLPGLTNLQQLGNAINGDTLFYQTVASSIATKLAVAGGTMTGTLVLNYVVDSNSNGLTAVNKNYVDSRAAVFTVNTKVGNVSLVTDDLAERTSPAASNLWFTQARARNSVSIVSSDTDVFSYNIGSGVFTFNKPNSDAIVEGATNQYYTVTKARQAIAVNVTGNTNFASYSQATGQLTINASSDNLSQGTTNKFYTDTLARTAISLATSTSQSGILSYNSGTGQFTVSAYTNNVPEGAAGPYYFSGARVNAAIALSITQLTNVPASSVFTASYSAGTGVTTLTFNSNTNSITEGTTNLYYTDSRARLAHTLTTNDATVLAYDSATGRFTFNKPTSDGISEGSTNLYFLNSRARGAVSALVTTTAGQTSANSFTYSSTTGAFTFNANTDNIVEGTTNKFATLARVAGLLSLTTTATNGAAPPAFLAYNNLTGVISFNNSTDSLTEGTVNQYYLNSRARSSVTVTNSTLTAGSAQNALIWGGSTGVASPRVVAAGVLDFGLLTNTSLTWTPSANGTSSFHLATAQDITTTGKPKFSYVTKGVVSITQSSATVNFDCSTGQFFNVTRNALITALTFTNVPATGQYFEVTISFTTAAFTITNGGGNTIKWAGAAIPVFTQTPAGRTDNIKLYTIDGGSTWFELSRALNLA